MDKRHQEKPRRKRPWKLVVFVLAVAGLVAVFGPHTQNLSEVRYIAKLNDNAFYSLVAERILEAAAASEGKTLENILCAQGAGWSSLFAEILPIGAKDGFLSLDVIDLDDRPLLIALGQNLIISRALIEDAEDSNTLLGLIAHEAGHGFHDHRTPAFIWDLALGWLWTPKSANASRESRHIDLWGVNIRFTAEEEREAHDYAVKTLRLLNIDQKSATSGRVARKTTGSEVSALEQYRQDHPKADLKGTTGAPVTGKIEPAFTTVEWQMVKSLCAEKRRQK